MGSKDIESLNMGGMLLFDPQLNEAPEHLVTLTRGFWLADTPCTQAFWKVLMGGNPSEFRDDLLRPVENVSWNDVQQALDKLSKLLAEICLVDLPTEAEWEYACRAGTTTQYSGGNTLTHAQARFAEGDYFGVREFRPSGSTPVASYAANSWGLFDMHGNVWEWCCDGLRKYAHAASDPVGPQNGSLRVARGGSWFGIAKYARSAYRREYRRNARLDDLGFRMVLRSLNPLVLSSHKVLALRRGFEENQLSDDHESQAH
jgi:formylglycine-generating enzyme required for sulfatase activity